MTASPLPPVLSLCTGAGFLDRAFIDTGFNVIAGCEIDPRMRAMYAALCGGEPLCYDLRGLPAIVAGQHFTGVIGGPPCQAHSKLRAMRGARFSDMGPAVDRLLASITCDWFLFENVIRIPIFGAQHTRLDAMHFHRPHQSRPRWFTHSRNLPPPAPIYSGTVDDLMAYPVVAGRLYGPKRGAVLQGLPEFASLPFPCVDLQAGLANAVCYPLALAWAQQAAAPDPP